MSLLGLLIIISNLMIVEPCGTSCRLAFLFCCIIFLQLFLVNVLLCLVSMKYSGGIKITAYQMFFEH